MTSTKNLLIIFFIVITSNIHINAQNTNNRASLKTVSESDYGKWERLKGATISNDGNWVSYEISTQNKDNSTTLFNTNTKSEIVFKNTSNSSFSKDNKWLLFNNVPTGDAVRKEAKNKKKNKKKPEVKRTLYNLKTKDSLALNGYSSSVFSDTGKYLALTRKDGNVLIIKNLISKAEVSFGNVKSFKWQDDKALIAMIIETKDKKGNAVQLFNPETGNLKVLDNENTTYSGLRWLKDSNNLFVVKAVEDKTFEKDTYKLLFWKNAGLKKEKLHTFDQTQYKNFPEDSRLLVDRIYFSKNNNAVYFRTFSRLKKDQTDKSNPKKKDTGSEEKDKKEVDKEEAPDVEIWNSEDEIIVPTQKKNRIKGVEKPINVVWHVNENKFLVLSNDLVERINIQEDNEVMIGLDGSPYSFEAMFGRPSNDVYTVNAKSGARNKVLENIVKVWSVSPNNKFFTYLKEDQIYLYNISNGVSTNLTKDVVGDFINFDDDHPLPQKRAYGFADWSLDSKSFFIYEKFDVWQFFTNGNSPKKITNGKDEGIVYRLENIEKEKTAIDVKKSVYFSMRGKYSKKSGYAKGVLGKKIKTLIYEDASVRKVSSKLEKSDKMLLVKQSYENSPNIFLTDLNLKNPKQISNTNSFQKDFAWGKTALVEYKSSQGNKLQGILYYPANYKKGTKYPMITYVYEKLSDRIHSYMAPSKYDYYNVTVWSQNDYFVLYADIEFEAGNPGISSAKTLENAVSSVVKLGDVNPNKVGLIGHSWGGYQAGYVPTQTDIFAASVAGAGLTDLISMNLAVTPAFGGRPENDHFEVGQERMNSAPWVSPENYLKNSSVMQIEKLNTPILFEVGDNDQNVNWSQGIAYYNAARRAAKPFVLLVYAKEGHGLRQNKNRYDYQQRILKWFGHYLKDEKAEDWIQKGIPILEQQRKLKNWNK